MLRTQRRVRWQRKMGATFRLQYEPEQRASRPSRRGDEGRQAERDAAAAGLTTDEQWRLEPLEREVFELRRANETLNKGSAIFAQATSTAAWNTESDGTRSTVPRSPTVPVARLGPETRRIDFSVPTGEDGLLALARVVTRWSGDRRPTRTKLRVFASAKLAPEGQQSTSSRALVQIGMKTNNSM